MSAGKRILKNFLSLSAAELATRVLGTILSIYIARVLGASVFGQLAFATTFVSYFKVVADFGLTPLGIREIAKDRRNTSFLGTNILTLQLVLSLGLLALLGLALHLSPLEDRAKLITFLFGLGIIPTALNMSYVFQGHEKMEYVAVSRVVTTIIYAVGGFLLIYALRDILILPFVSLVSAFAGVLVVFYFLRKKFNFVLSRVNWGFIQSLIREALPFLITALMVNIYTNFGTIVLQFMKGEEVVGFYNASHKIIYLILSFSGFITWSLFPLLSATYVKSKSSFRKLVLSSSRLLGLVAVPISVGGFTLSRELVGFVYGPEYHASALVFSILAWVPVFALVNGIIWSSLASSGHQRVVTKAVVIGAVLSVVLNLLLVPRFSLYGASVVAVVAEVIVFAYLYFSQSRILKIQSSSVYFAKPFVSSLFMAAILFSLPSSFHLLVKVLIGILSYLVALFLTRGVDSQDLDMAKRLLVDGSKSSAGKD